jgi:hypothetical protein
MNAIIDHIARIEIQGDTVQIIKNGHVGMRVFRDGLGQMMVGIFQEEIMQYHKDMIKETMELAEKVL